MCRSELHRAYPFLFAYLVFLAPDSLGPLVMDLRSRAYFRFWLITEPINWAFEILVVRELCGLVLARYKGLCSLGRWTMYAGIAISGAISLASMLPRIPDALSHRSRLLFYWYGADRGINFALGIFLILMVLAASRYPVPVSRNVVLNASVFTAVFLSSTLASLLRTVFDFRVSSQTNVMLTAVNAASLAVWLFVLTPKGEEIRVELAHFHPEHETRILQRLDQINRLVLRLAER